jgi:hypothetical protein
MSKDGFVNDLLKHIINGVNIPKVQVERAISPILSFFIESILSSYFRNHSEYSGSYELISPEFPLKKENNQSTNIDYLLFNNSKKLLVLFELKTDSSSFNPEQMNEFIEYRNRIQESSASFIRGDLKKISRASSKSSKYEHTSFKFDAAVKSAEEVKKAILVYLMPNATKVQIGKGKVDFVLDFNDLPESIEHKYSNYWQDIRSNLVTLDFGNKKPKNIKNHSTNPLKNIVGNINQYLLDSNSMAQPIYIQLGILGSGMTPNYQVKFDDGSVKTFRFSGKPHHLQQFKDENLGVRQYWENIRNQAEQLDCS